MRLFHLYVHEPLIRQGVDALQMAEEMEGLARDLLPITSPLMEYIHQRYLRFYIEQDVVGHMEAELGGQQQLGRVQMAFCFVDLTGFTRYTEEEGDEEALRPRGALRRDGRGDAPVRGADREDDRRRGDDRLAGPGDADRVGGRLPRACSASGRSRGSGFTTGRAVYRDGDYFGSEVNLTHRVVARALGGEVMVTTAGRRRDRRLRLSGVRPDRRASSSRASPSRSSCSSPAPGSPTTALERLARRSRPESAVRA